MKWILELRCSLLLLFQDNADPCNRVQKFVTWKNWEYGFYTEHQSSSMVLQVGGYNLGLWTRCNFVTALLLCFVGHRNRGYFGGYQRARGRASFYVPHPGE
jgi:hypothetical protein